MENFNIRKKLKVEILLGLFLLMRNIPCWGEVTSFRFTEEEVRNMETIDHETCLSRGHDLVDQYSLRFYWGCRLQLMDLRLQDFHNRRGVNKFYLRELRRLRKVLENHLDSVGDNMSGVAEEGKLILRKSSAYYYNQLNFSEYDFKTVAVNTSAEIAEMVATKKVLDADAQQKSLRYKLEKYPICARFDMDNRLFDRCVNVHLQLDKCKSLVAVRVSAIDHKDKFDCKKYAIEKYPDHLALYNSEYLELKELKNKKKDEFIVNKEQEEAVEKRLLELNKLMSGPRLSSTQLLNLRKFEEDKCNLDKRLENSALKMVLENECKGPSKELEDILHL